MIQEINRGPWIYFLNQEARADSKDVIKGKYLFFSDDKTKLIEIGKKMLVENNLSHFKIPASDIPNKGEGFGFVLCLYDTEPKLKYKLSKYEEEGVNYRYWKSDDDTRTGKYSENYKKEK